MAFTAAGLPRAQHVQHSRDQELDDQEARVDQRRQRRGIAQRVAEDVAAGDRDRDGLRPHRRGFEDLLLHGFPSH
jgi:hypothetical protein